MNILCKICYFVIRKCDCIGVYLIAIQSKSFNNVTAIEQNKVEWTFCARFAILLLESVIALVYLVAIQSKTFKNVTIIEQNNVKWTFCARFAILLLESVIALVYLVAIQSKTFKNVTIIEQNNVKWTFCSRFAILLLESVIALVCIWLQFKANHSRMWWQLNRIKCNEHFVQDLLFCYWKVLFHWCVFVAIQSKSFKNVTAIEQNKV